MSVQMELHKIIIRESDEQQIIVLKEVDGEREFSIVIGVPEAYAIDRRLKGIPTARPLTHDLLATVIEFVTDPNVPPLPPHITLAQAKAFASTLMHGDPDESNVLVDTAKQVLSAVQPGHKA